MSRSKYDAWLVIIHDSRGLVDVEAHEFFTRRHGGFFRCARLCHFAGHHCHSQYRILYRDAPLPLSPAHGVVVVNPNTTDTIAASCANDEHITGCSCLGGRRWRNTTHVSESERQILARALEERPLRLLVIGDSLAIGVGTSRSCTPLMPEVIAQPSPRRWEDELSIGRATESPVLVLDGLTRTGTWRWKKLIESTTIVKL